MIVETLVNTKIEYFIKISKNKVDFISVDFCLSRSPSGDGVFDHTKSS